MEIVNSKKLDSYLYMNYFRGKSIKTGKWLYGYLGESQYMHMLWGGNCSIHKCIFTNLNHFSTDNYIYVLEDCSVEELSIGRNMFIKDKNLIEMFEGDIVKVPAIDPIFGDMIEDLFVNALVTYNDGMPVVKYYTVDRYIYLDQIKDKCEVVGNIFDNPELLNTENLYY